MATTLPRGDLRGTGLTPSAGSLQWTEARHDGFTASAHDHTEFVRDATARLLDRYARLLRRLETA